MICGIVVYVVNYLVGGWPYPSEKYEFVSWDDYSQYIVETIFWLDMM